MIKWKALAKPRGYGGFGFIDKKAISIALLVKWINKLDIGVENIATKLLHKKYLKGGSFCQSKAGRGGS